jgi:hypothetical protein
MPRRIDLLLEFLDFPCQPRQNLQRVADDAVGCDFEDRCVLVLVDRHDGDCGSQRFSELSLLFSPEPHRERTWSYDSKDTDPHWDLNVSSSNWHLENDAQHMEHCNQCQEQCCN